MSNWANPKFVIKDKQVNAENRLYSFFVTSYYPLDISFDNSLLSSSDHGKCFFNSSPASKFRLLNLA
jgi:hypothetical protein